MWLDVDMQDARYRDLYGAHRALVDRAASGMQDTWTAAAWLSSESLGIAKYVAEALLGGARPADELAAMRALGTATTSEAALAERLRAGGLLELLPKVMLPKLLELVAADVATGVELHSKVIAARFEPTALRLHVKRVCHSRFGVSRLEVRIPLAFSLCRKARRFR